MFEAWLRNDRQRSARSGVDVEEGRPVGLR